MDKEKVKEIKNALKFMMGLDLSNKLPYIDGNTIKQIAYEEIFNYINELEGENEALWKGVKRLKKRYKETITKNADECVKKFCETVMYKEQDKLVNENQQLKDQIAELKMENATKIDTIAGLLKHFVERLKEKVVDKSENYVNQVVMATDIDETLKEFTDGKV